MSLIKIFFSACLLLTPRGFIQECMYASPPSEGNMESVKIGLLISDNRCIEASNAATMAVMEANEKGGYNRIPFELVIRSMEGSWGTGSKQTVNLIFEEKVAAIVGSHDGRNAHLAEQVCTKAHVIFISAWAGDPTLAQAFVPWFYNCVPNDIQQAVFLIKTIFDRNKHSKIALVGDGSYDSESAIKNLLKITRKEEKDDPAIIRFNKNEEELNSMFISMTKSGVNTLVLTGEPAAANQFLKRLEERNMFPSVYCHLSVMGEVFPESGSLDYLDGALTLTSGTWYKSSESGFNHNYRVKFGRAPGAMAAYSYDATKLIIEAIKAAGTDREDIQKWLLEMQYIGVTGTIKFDDKGNRLGEFYLGNIKKGNPVDIQRNK